MSFYDDTKSNEKYKFKNDHHQKIIVLLTLEYT